MLALEKNYFSHILVIILEKNTNIIFVIRGMLAQALKRRF